MTEVYEVAIDKVKPGTRLKCDDGFTCLNKGAVRKVRRDELGNYILCREGHHYLDGQIGSTNDKVYVGLRLVE
jgi:hypothetical protein